MGDKDLSFTILLKQEIVKYDVNVKSIIQVG